MIKYMGDDYPTVGFEEDPGRRVNTYSGDTEPVVGGDSGLSRWAVAVVVCPLCRAQHEHPVARVAGWGWYSAPCDRDPKVGYYLHTTITVG
ncbi:MAG: hypothetical protein ACRDRO_15070 [Pseudonocardiaceae bacterium]